jgi:preprotein translocase subunit SecG
MENVILTIHLILALALIGIVLLQRSEGGALGMGGGGTGSMAARSQATGLTKLTWILAACFITTSLTLTILATRGTGAGSVVDSVTTEETAPATDAPATPGLSGDLLPPSATDAPATAPRADEPAAPAAPAAPATNP